MELGRPKQVPLACRYVSQDQWFLTHVPPASKVKHLKQVILAKCHNLPYDPWLLLQDDPEARAPSPITFAPVDAVLGGVGLTDGEDALSLFDVGVGQGEDEANGDRRDSPVEFASTEGMGGVGGEEGYEEDDEWEEEDGKPPLGGGRVIVPGREGKLNGRLAGKRDLAGLASPSHSHSQPTIHPHPPPPPEIPIPTDGYTLIRFSTGQVLEDDFLLVWYNVEPYELVELHTSTPPATFALTTALFQPQKTNDTSASDPALGGQVDALIADTFFNPLSGAGKSNAKHPHEEDTKVVKITPLPRHDIPAYVRPFWEGWVRSLRAVLRASEESSGVNQAPGHEREKERKLTKERPRGQSRCEWKERWVVIRDGIVHVHRAQTDLKPTHSLPLTSLISLEGVEHLAELIKRKSQTNQAAETQSQIQTASRAATHTRDERSRGRATSSRMDEGPDRAKDGDMGGDGKGHGKDVGSRSAPIYGAKEGGGVTATSPALRPRSRSQSRSRSGVGPVLGGRAAAGPSSSKTQTKTPVASLDHGRGREEGQRPTQVDRERQKQREAERERQKEKERERRKRREKEDKDLEALRNWDHIGFGMPFGRKDKGKGKEKDGQGSKDKKGGDKDKAKDKDKGGEKKGNDKERGEKDRTKAAEREKEREREREREKEKARERENEKEKREREQLRSRGGKVTGKPSMDRLSNRAKDVPHRRGRDDKSFIPRSKEEAEAAGMRIVCAKFIHLRDEEPLPVVPPMVGPGARYTSTGPTLAGEPTLPTAPVPASSVPDYDSRGYPHLQHHLGPQLRGRGHRDSPVSLPSSPSATRSHFPPLHRSMLRPSASASASLSLSVKTDEATLHPFVPPRKSSLPSLGFALLGGGGDKEKERGSSSRSFVGPSSPGPKFGLGLHLFGDDKDKGQKNQEEKDRKAREKEQKRMDKKDEEDTFGMGSALGWTLGVGKNHTQTRSRSKSDAIFMVAPAPSDTTTTMSVGSRTEQEEGTDTSIPPPPPPPPSSHPLPIPRPTYPSSPSSLPSRSHSAHASRPPVPLWSHHGQVPEPHSHSDSDSSDDPSTQAVIVRLTGEMGTRIRINESLDSLRNLSLSGGGVGRYGGTVMMRRSGVGIDDMEEQQEESPNDGEKAGFGQERGREREEKADAVVMVTTSTTTSNDRGSFPLPPTMVEASSMTVGMGVGIGPSGKARRVGSLRSAVSQGALSLESVDEHPPLPPTDPHSEVQAGQATTDHSKPPSSIQHTGDGVMRTADNRPSSPYSSSSLSSPVFAHSSDESSDWEHSIGGDGDGEQHHHHNPKARRARAGYRFGGGVVQPHQNSQAQVTVSPDGEMEDEGEKKERERVDMEQETRPRKRENEKAEWIVLDMGTDTAFNNILRVLHREFPSPVPSTFMTQAGLELGMFHTQPPPSTHSEAQPRSMPDAPMDSDAESDAERPPKIKIKRPLQAKKPYHPPVLTSLVPQHRRLDTSAELKGEDAMYAQVALPYPEWRVALMRRARMYGMREAGRPLDVAEGGGRLTTEGQRWGGRIGSMKVCEEERESGAKNEKKGKAVKRASQHSHGSTIRPGQDKGKGKEKAKASMATGSEADEFAEEEDEADEYDPPSEVTSLDEEEEEEEIGVERDTLLTDFAIIDSEEESETEWLAWMADLPRQMSRKGRLGRGVGWRQLALTSGIGPAAPIFSNPFGQSSGGGRGGGDWASSGFGPIRPTPLSMHERLIAMELEKRRNLEPSGNPQYPLYRTLHHHHRSQNTLSSPSSSESLYRSHGGRFAFAFPGGDPSSSSGTTLVATPSTQGSHEFGLSQSQIHAKGHGHARAHSKSLSGPFAHYRLCAGGSVSPPRGQSPPKGQALHHSASVPPHHPPLHRQTQSHARAGPQTPPYPFSAPILTPAQITKIESEEGPMPSVVISPHPASATSSALSSPNPCTLHFPGSISTGVGSTGAPFVGRVLRTRFSDLGVGLAKDKEPDLLECEEAQESERAVDQERQKTKPKLTLAVHSSPPVYHHLILGQEEHKGPAASSSCAPSMSHNHIPIPILQDTSVPSASGSWSKSRSLPRRVRSGSSLHAEEGNYNSVSTAAIASSSLGQGAGTPSRSNIAVKKRKRAAAAVDRIVKGLDNALDFVEGK